MTKLIMPRRAFLSGVASLFAAPTVVRAQNLMPIKVLPFDPYMVIRGRSLFTNEWIEKRIYEKAGDPFAFLSDDFHTRLGRAIGSMSTATLKTAAIENHADEKAMRLIDVGTTKGIYLEHDYNCSFDSRKFWEDA
jgi:hypothetical protein